MKILVPIKILFGILLATTLFVLPAVASDCSQPVVANAAEATEALDNLRLDGCLGGDACTTALCTKINDFVKKWCDTDQGPALFCSPREQDSSEVTTAIFAEAKSLLEDIQGTAELLPVDGTAVPQLRGMMKRWQDVFNSPDSASVSGSRMTEWETGGMRLFPDTIYMIDIEEAFAEACTNAQKCQESFNSARAVYTEAALTQRVLGVVAGKDVQDVFKRLDLLDRRWHAYHNQTRAIYPWELLLNGYLVHESKEKGFADPPDKQILFLHPSAGLEYKFSGDDHLQEAILLDVIGLYRWSWGGESGADIKRPWGLSAAVSYDGDEVYYGATAHFPKNWSIGVGADRHGKIALTLSADIGNFLLDKTKAVDRLKMKFQ